MAKISDLFYHQGMVPVGEITPILFICIALESESFYDTGSHS